MSATFNCQSAQSALLIVDLQCYFTQPGHAFSRLSASRVDGGIAGYFERLDHLVLANVGALAAAFRQHECPVIFTVLGSTHPDGHDLPAWARRLNADGRQAFGAAVIPCLQDSSAAIDPRVAPAPGDAMVPKTTTGALASSPLAHRLRSQGVRSVVVTGVLTAFCVAQTARELADRDFDVAIVEDATASLTPAAQVAALHTFSALYGWVLSTAELLAQLDR